MQALTCKNQNEFNEIYENLATFKADIYSQRITLKKNEDGSWTPQVCNKSFWIIRVIKKIGSWFGLTTNTPKKVTEVVLDFFRKNREMLGDLPVSRNLLAIKQPDLSLFTDLCTIAQEQIAKSVEKHFEGEKEQLLGNQERANQERTAEINREKESLNQERKEIKQEREGMNQEREGMNQEREGMDQEREGMNQERERMDQERERMNQERERMNQERKEIKQEKEAEINREREGINQEKERMKQDKEAEINREKERMKQDKEAEINREKERMKQDKEAEINREREGINQERERMKQEKEAEISQERERVNQEREEINQERKKIEQEREERNIVNGFDLRDLSVETRNAFEAWQESDVVPENLLANIELLKLAEEIGKEKLFDQCRFAIKKTVMLDFDSLIKVVVSNAPISKSIDNFLLECLMEVWFDRKGKFDFKELENKNLVAMNQQIFPSSCGNLIMAGCLAGVYSRAQHEHIKLKSERLHSAAVENADEYGKKLIKILSLLQSISQGDRSEECFYEICIMHKDGFKMASAARAFVLWDFNVKEKSYKDNRKEAEKYLELTQDQCLFSKFAYGFFKFYGYSLEKNEEELGFPDTGLADASLDQRRAASFGRVQGFSLIKEAADAGSLTATIALGVILLDFEVIENKAEEGLALLQKASEANFPLAKLELGKYYRGMFRGSPQEADHFLAQEAFLEGVELNQPHCHYEMGLYSKEGIHAVMNLGQANQYFEWAADAGHAEAQFELGMYFKYSKEDGLESDRARGYFEQAANVGHMQAQEELDDMLKKV